MAGWLREQGYDVRGRDGPRSGPEAHQASSRSIWCWPTFAWPTATASRSSPIAASTIRTSTVILITGYGTVETGIDALAGRGLRSAHQAADRRRAGAWRSTGRSSQRKVIEENQKLKAQLDLRFGLENIVGHDHRMQRVFDMVDRDRRHQGDGADHRRKRHGQVAARPGDPSPQRPPRPVVRRSRLRRAARDAAGKRAVRPRRRLVHRRDSATRSASSRRPTRARFFSTRSAPSSPSLQVKLLRVLQEFEFEPVGSTKTQQVDTRVILATNEDLAQAVPQGRFRQDLYYRVNVINIELPPLRERLADIPLLAQHFLARTCEEAGKKSQRLHRRRPGRACSAIDWPGNVRELQNVVERAVLLGRGPQGRRSRTCPRTSPPASPRASEPLAGKALKDAMEAPERAIILEVLELQQLEPQRHGRRPRHQPHDALQEDEAAGADVRAARRPTIVHPPSLLTLAIDKSIRPLARPKYEEPLSSLAIRQPSDRRHARQHERSVAAQAPAAGALCTLCGAGPVDRLCHLVLDALGAACARPRPCLDAPCRCQVEQ